MSVPALTTLDSSIKTGAKTFKVALDALLLEFVGAERARYESIAPNPQLTAIFTHLERLCLGGKRLRPYMAYRLYTHTHPDATVEDIGNILLAIELFHIFCLIHDDIMDEAPLRHGVPTLHRFGSDIVYKETVNRERSGESQAILVGDMVFNMTFKLLTTAPSQQLPYAREIPTVFHTLVEEVCLGQMLDIDLTTKSKATEAEVVAKNRLKTAYYSFARPLHIGTLLATRPDLTDVAIAFGEQIGLLYQVQDDLLDIVGDAGDTQKEPFQDVTQNQHTVLTTYLRAHGGEAAALLDLCVGRVLSGEEKTALRDAFTESGAIDYAHTLIASHTNQARTILDTATLPEADEVLFLDILSLLNNRTA